MNNTQTGFEARTVEIIMLTRLRWPPVSRILRILMQPLFSDSREGLKTLALMCNIHVYMRDVIISYMLKRLRVCCSDFPRSKTKTSIKILDTSRFLFVLRRGVFALQSEVNRASLTCVTRCPHKYLSADKLLLSWRL